MYFRHSITGTDEFEPGVCSAPVSCDLECLASCLPRANGQQLCPFDKAAHVPRLLILQLSMSMHTRLRFDVHVHHTDVQYSMDIQTKRRPGRMQGPGCSLIAKGCSFSENEASGLWAVAGASVTLDDCKLLGNDLNGLSLWDSGSTAVVQRCQVARNGRHGVRVLYGGRATLAGCEMVDNGGSGLEVGIQRSCAHSSGCRFAGAPPWKPCLMAG